MVSISIVAFAVTAVAAAAAVVWALFARWQARVLRGELAAARQIVDLGNDAVLVADLVRGRILYANRAACEMLGCDRGQLLTCRLPELHPPELVQRSAEVIADIWEKGGLVYTDLPLVRDDGSTVEVEISANLATFAGQPAVVLYARDICERLAAEQQIRDYTEQLEAANREIRDAQASLVQSEKMAALGNLVAGVAHEINTPTGAITSGASVARRALGIIKDACEQHGVLEHEKAMRAMTVLEQTCQTNQSACDRISGIVRSLRSFARLDEADEKKVDVHECLESTLLLLQYQLEQGVKVIRDFAELPEVFCHPNQINQVFMHLAVNASHAMGGEGTLTISTRPAGKCVEITFTDTGPGIAPEHLPQIFNPGFTTKGVGVGTGLGLSICYRIVQDHGGELTVQSDPGEGARFTVRLPIGVHERSHQAITSSHAILHPRAAQRESVAFSQSTLTTYGRSKS